MSAFPLPVQAQSFSLNGAGAVAGATTVVLKSFKQIDGVTNIVTADFGGIGYGTLEPGNGTLEEQISFTGVTQNANGTATLTGVKTVLFTTPYTETSGLAKTHAGATTFVISNDAGFYYAVKGYIDTALSAGAVPATTTVNGIGHVSVTPSDAANPVFIGTNDPRIFPTAYAVDAGSTDDYAITLSTAPLAYAAGQVYAFKANTVNTGVATLNINSLGAKSILNSDGSALADGVIVSGSIVTVIYDGTNFRLGNYLPSITNVQTFTSSGSWTKPAGAKSVFVQLIGGGAGGQGGAGNGSGSGTLPGLGGGSGSYTNSLISASLISSPVTITIGGGSAGTIGTNSAIGAVPSAGGATSFGTYLTAVGGISNTTTASFLPGSKGGDGGAITGGGQDGATSLFNSALVGGTGGTGGATPQAGTNGSSATVGWPIRGGTGGGGGGANNGSAINGAKGGNGGLYGAGGGGGGQGGTTNGTGGTGGDGANGIAVITTYF